MRFSEFVDLMRRHGWELTRLWGTFRVFSAPGTSHLPVLVEVIDGEVSDDDVERIARDVLSEPPEGAA